MLQDIRLVVAFAENPSRFLQESVSKVNNNICNKITAVKSAEI
jgi:hypothetical protein